MRDNCPTETEERPRSEVQNLAEHAGLCVGLSLGQAARFGVAAVCHLAAGREASLLSDLLGSPDAIVKLAGRVDAAVEQSTLTRDPIPISHDNTDLLESFLEALPCSVELWAAPSGVRVVIASDQPSQVAPAGSVLVATTFWAQMQAVVANASDQPRGGAQLMEL